MFCVRVLLAKRIPGVVYGVDESKNIVKTMFTVAQKDLMRELRLKGQSFENTIYEISLVRPIDGAEPVAVEGSTQLVQPTELISKFLAAPRQVHFSPGNFIFYFLYLIGIFSPDVFYSIFETIIVSEQPVNVNFLRYWPGVTRLRIPVEFANQESSQDMRRGCFLVRVHQFVECICDGEVPSKIVADLSEAKKGDVIRLSNVKLPPQVRPAKKVPLDFVLGVVQSARG